MKNLKFGELLSEAIQVIKLCRGTSIAIIEDELGYALGRKGGAAIERWRQGNLPPTVQDRENLARIIFSLSCGKLDRKWFEAFLEELEDPYPRILCDELFPPNGIADEVAGSKEGKSTRLPSVFQVPSPIADFVGRENLLLELKNQLPVDGSICVLSGMGGVGKTELAKQAAYEVCQQFPDGVLWGDLETAVDEKGKLRPSTIMTILATFARAFKVELKEEYQIADRSRVVREILADKRILIVLDNAYGNDDVEPLLPSANTACSVLITTRTRQILDDKKPKVFEVKEFTNTDSLTLLQQIIGEERVNQELAGAKQIIDFLGGLPLAIRIIANIIAETYDLTLLEYAEELQNVRALLVKDVSKKSRVETSFELSFRRLEPIFQQVFISLGVLSNEFNSATVAAINDLPLITVKRILGRFRSLSLIDNLGTQNQNMGRFHIHPLLRAFARDKLDQIQLRSLEANKGEMLSDKFLKQLKQLLSKYLNSNELRALCFELDVDFDDLAGNTKSALVQELLGLMARESRLDELLTTLRRFRPRVQWPEPEPLQMQQPLSFDLDENLLMQRATQYFLDFTRKHRREYQEFDLEWKNIQLVLDWAQKKQDWANLVECITHLTFVHLGVVGYLDARGFWKDASKFLEQITRIPLLIEDPIVHATLLLKRGAFAYRLAKFKDATLRLRQSQNILDELPQNEHVGFCQAYVSDFLSQLKMSSNLREALKHAQQGVMALAPFETENLVYEKGYLLIRQGTLQARNGDLPGSKLVIEQGLEMLPDYPTAAQISGLMNLGNIHDMQEEYEQAARCWQDGITLAQKLQDIRRLAGLRRNLAILAEKRGEMDRSITLNEEALGDYRLIGDLAGEGHTASNLGIVYLLIGNIESATPHILHAQEVAQQIEAIDLKVFSKMAIVRWHMYYNRLDEAETLVDEALKMSQKMDLLETMAEIIRLQALIALQRAAYDKALVLIDKSLGTVVDKEQLIEIGNSWRVKGDVLGALRQFEDADAAYAKSIEILAEAYPFHRARAELAWAQQLVDRGDFDRARSLLETAGKSFEASATPRLLAQVMALSSRIAS